MKRTQKIFCTLGMAFATGLMVGPAAAEQPPAQDSSQTMAMKMSATATVEKIDTAKRDLMLKDEQGNEFMVNVPESVTRFDAIKKGDKIKVDYYQSVGLSLKKGEAGAQPGAHETTMGERTSGNLPGGIVARKITAPAEVIKVDRANNKVTIKGPNGEMDTINVTDPAVKADLAKLKKGDRIQASYTEAVAISVMPPEKKE